MLKQRSIVASVAVPSPEIDQDYLLSDKSNNSKYNKKMIVGPVLIKYSQCSDNSSNLMQKMI